MATIYKRGKTYWIKWYEEGVPKYESLRTSNKKTALTAKAAKELELHTGGVTVARANCTFGEFVEDYLSWYEGENPSLFKKRRSLFDRVFIPEFGKHRLASLDPHLVDRWKHGRAKEISERTGRQRRRTTVNLELKILKAAVNKAVDWGVIPVSPIRGVKPLQIMEANPRKFFTSEQLEQIYAADPKYAAVWRFLANTGLRSGEARALQWSNVLPNAVRVLSTAQHSTKNRKWRDVPISPGCERALVSLRAFGQTGSVLPKMSASTMHVRFKAACEGAGVDGTIHELRHTFISHLVMQGVPLRTVQTLAGHSSIAVTEQYAHLAPGHLMDAVSGLRL